MLRNGLKNFQSIRISRIIKIKLISLSFTSKDNNTVFDKREYK